MTLAYMLRADRNALICDFAETYGIYDIYGFKASYIAVLACGLDDNSRIKRKINGIRASTTDLLLSLILDMTNTLVWMNSKDGVEGRNRPKSVYRSIMGLDDSSEYDSVTIDDFEAEWLKRGGGKHG